MNQQEIVNGTRMTYKIVISNLNEYHLMKKIFVIILVTILPFIHISEEKAFGRTKFATSCSNMDVQEAIDSASDGDIVIVPSGECIWTTGVFFSNKGITIQGAGIDQTTIVDSTGNSWGNELLNITTELGDTLRITGITFDGVPLSTENIYLKGTSKAFRIDHCKFKQYRTSGRTIWIEGPYGVIDHCTFINSYSGIYIVGPSDSWNDTLNLGSADAVYIEDCIFSNDQVYDGFIDSRAGSRYVVRYNDFINDGIQHHGNCTHLSGGLSEEIYGNNFTSSYDLGLRVIFLRSGTATIFNNIVTTTGSYDFAQMANYRSCYPERHQNCALHYGACNGSQTVDGNQATVNGTGLHTGANNASVLIDSTQNWIPNEWVGYWVWNLTDSSFGEIDSNTTTTVYATLVEAPLASGYYDGPNNNNYLIWPPGRDRSGFEWTINQWQGYTIQNVSDGSSAIIDSNSTYEVFGTLSGGTDNDWDSNKTGSRPNWNPDEFRIFSGSPEKDWDTGDSYKITNGYPCLDQIGRGPDSDNNGLQDLVPMYEWNNTLNGGNANLEVSPVECERAFNHIQENRDYYNDIPRPGYTPYTYPHPLTKELAFSYIWDQTETQDIVQPLELVTDENSGAACDRFIWLPPDLLINRNPPYQPAGEVSFELEVEKSGDYIVWGRTFAPNENSNSFFVSVDGGADEIWEVQTSNDWIWDQVNVKDQMDPRIFSLSSGTHILKVKGLEVGTKLDMILTTDDMVYVPSNILEGPPCPPTGLKVIE